MGRKTNKSRGPGALGGERYGLSPGKHREPATYTFLFPSEHRAHRVAVSAQASRSARKDNPDSSNRWMAAESNGSSSSPAIYQLCKISGKLLPLFQPQFLIYKMGSISSPTS